MAVSLRNFDHKVRKQRQKELKELKLECKELDQKISKVQLDRDNLHKTFTENIQKVQLKADSNIMRLEKKLKDLTDNVKKTQAQFSSVLSASNVDQSALGGVINKMEEYLDSVIILSRTCSLEKLRFPRPIRICC
ncbi:dynein regulatory complex subunit 4-like [Siniperca chuatsi]|uniref:dynein regulatory complex subunit 4-like n=1 Tax=Siniperca chuatsi TaxID=119488 RepID=UPI001CE229BD|nr:dynein regulatory complex subunit 4-like [Siniperca chuatsi]